MKNRDLGFNPYDELSKREWVINALKGENNSLRKLIIVSILDTCSETTRKLVYYQNPEILIFALLLKKLKQQTDMKITIEITSAELAQLVDRLHQKEVPCILDELHEDLQVEPDSETDGKADEKPEDPAVYTPEPPEPVKPLRRKGGRKPKSVDVLMNNGQWKMFESASDAGAYLGVPGCRILTSIKNGHRVKGFEVREHEEGDDEEDE